MTRPRRILTIAHSYAVGRNRRLADAMARAGGGAWEVTAIAPASFPGDFGRVTCEPATGVHCGVETVPARAARPIHLLHYGGRFKRILRQSWDVVHCWEEPYILAAAQVAWHVRPEPVLAFASFQNQAKTYPPPFAQLERFAMRRADGWIAFGRTVEQALAGRDGYQELPRRVIPPGLDLNDFFPDPAAGARLRAELGWADQATPVVGYLGRFVPEKGLTTLMHALDGLGEPWRALFVGGGPMERSLRRWAAAYPDRVRICTGVPHDRVRIYLNAMDMICAPSRATRRWREQFGRMLVEALACGVPVLASASGEIPHVVGDAGILLPEDDSRAWQSAIGALAHDPARRANLARRGLSRARERFSIDVTARQHLEFFDELLRQRHSPGTAP